MEIHVVLYLFANVLLHNISVNKVLDRMFSGRFSLNVRTATIGGHLPIQYPNLLQPPPCPMVQSHEGKYTIPQYTKGGRTAGATEAVAS